MSLQFLVWLNLSLALYRVEGQAFLVIKLHENHHLVPCHVNFIFFAKICIKIEGSKVQFPS